MVHYSIFDIMLVKIKIDRGARFSLRGGVNYPTSSSWLPLTRHSEGGWGGAREGGGSGGEQDSGRRENKRREEVKSATEQGRSHRSRSIREVGWEEQEKMWEVSWRDPLQEGQRSSGVLRINSR